MTYKQRTIQACIELMITYMKAILKHSYLNLKYCPLCKIYYNSKHPCKGCFLNKNYEVYGTGCTYFRTYIDIRKAKRLYDNEQYLYTGKECIPDFKQALRKRGEFYNNILPILEKYPEKDFWPSSPGTFDKITYDL